MWNWVRCTVLYTIELQTRVTLTHPRPVSFPVLVFAQGTKAGFVVITPARGTLPVVRSPGKAPLRKEFHALQRPRTRFGAGKHTYRNFR